MVQVLGRLALSFGIFSVAGLSGWLAAVCSPIETVFLLGLIVPLISVSGALLVIRGDRASAGRPTGASSAAASCSVRSLLALGLSSIPFSQEIVFVVSMAVVIWMLRA